MTKKYLIVELLKNYNYFINKKIMVEGWIRSFRFSIFIDLNDGSTIKNLQVVLCKKEDIYKKKLTIGSSVKIIGIIKKSIGKEQNIELKPTKIEIYSITDPNILQKSILQPKKHSLEKLREQVHLRFQTSLFSSIMRIRSEASFYIHKYFKKKNFFYIHTPIITTSNCEGNSKMFQVTTLKSDNSSEKKNYSKDFFKKKTYLNVSGQLEAESAILGLNRVYTFGPVFRAENSNTVKHLSEFWMVEPEIAFYNIKDIIFLAEDFLKYIIQNIINNCKNDILFLNKNIRKWNNEKKDFLLKRLESILKCNFLKLSYTEAIEILIFEKKKNKILFYNPVKWGIDIQPEHEQYLTDKYFKCPIVIFDYPSCIKPFYMRLNNNEKTVNAMDILFPKIGEIIGGSQREERYHVLLKRMKETKTDINNLWWYLETRRFGSVPHSGFGLGFDRLIQFLTGVNNIRDVISFPRTPGNANF